MLHDVAEQYGGSTVSEWSRLTLADWQLDGGTNRLLVDRTLARDQLREAIEKYQAVILQAIRQHDLLERATYGLARAQEAYGELDKAREELSIELATTWPESPFAATAKARAEILESQPDQAVLRLDRQVRAAASRCQENRVPRCSARLLEGTGCGHAQRAGSSLGDATGEVPDVAPEPPRRSQPLAKRRHRRPNCRPPTAPRRQRDSRPRREPAPARLSPLRSKALSRQPRPLAADEVPMSGDELSSEPQELIVPPEHAGARFDWFLAQQFSSYSRVMLRKVINAAGVQVEGKRVKARTSCRAASKSRSPCRNCRAKARGPRTFRSKSSTRTSTWRRSTSRRAWSCIRARAIGRAR